MGLTNAREEQLKRMPYVESFVTKSKDGKYVIHRTIITNVKPLNYYAAILASSSQELELSNEVGA